LLAQLGITPQKPLWRAYQQDPELVRRWIKEEYPNPNKSEQNKPQKHGITEKIFLDS